jgi:hypothetical protein
MPSLKQQYDNSNASLEIRLSIQEQHNPNDGSYDKNSNTIPYELTLLKDDVDLHSKTGFVSDTDIRAIEMLMRNMSTKSPKRVEQSYTAPFVSEFGILTNTSRINPDLRYITVNIDYGASVYGKGDGSCISIRLVVDRSECKKFAEELRQDLDSIVSI